MRQHKDRQNNMVQENREMKDIDTGNIQVAGFDLDHTLHFFKRASGAVAEKVFFSPNKSFGVTFKILETARISLSRTGLQPLSIFKMRF